MHRALASLALTLTLAFAAPAQEQQGGPAQGALAESRREQLARTYGLASWPAPAARLRGLEAGALEVQGWSRCSLTIDPRRAEAALTFSPAGGDEPTALVRLALHEDARAAREALLLRLGAVQTKLQPEAGPCDAAFAARDPAGKLRLLCAVLGDATLVVQRIGATGRGALEELVRAAERLLLEAPRLAAGEARPAPRLLSARLERAPEGEGLPLRLELDPAGPAARFVAFEGPSGVSAVRAADGGWFLHGAAPGPLRLRAWACSDALQAAELELALEVPGPR